jgi:hypothetical protein
VYRLIRRDIDGPGRRSTGDLEGERKGECVIGGFERDHVPVARMTDELQPLASEVNYCRRAHDNGSVASATLADVAAR